METLPPPLPSSPSLLPSSPSLPLPLSHPLPSSPLLQVQQAVLEANKSRVLTPLEIIPTEPPAAQQQQQQQQGQSQGQGQGRATPLLALVWIFLK